MHVHGDVAVSADIGEIRLRTEKGPFTLQGGDIFRCMQMYSRR